MVAVGRPGMKEFGLNDRFMKKVLFTAVVLLFVISGLSAGKQSGKEKTPLYQRYPGILNNDLSRQGLYPDKK